jgi:co-chaperonin GroES (HSP10)
MIVPAGYRLLVKPDVIEEKTQGGIIIPATEREKQQFRQSTATVFSIGEFAWQDYKGQWAKVGDKVLTKEYPGVLVKDPDTGEEYRLLNDVDILAIIK